MKLNINNNNFNYINHNIIHNIDLSTSRKDKNMRNNKSGKNAFSPSFNQTSYLTYKNTNQSYSNFKKNKFSEKTNGIN